MKQRLIFLGVMLRLKSTKVFVPVCAGVPCSALEQECISRAGKPFRLPLRYRCSQFNQSHALFDPEGLLRQHHGQILGSSSPSQIKEAKSWGKTSQRRSMSESMSASPRAIKLRTDGRLKS